LPRSKWVAAINLALLCASNFGSNALLCSIVRAPLDLPAPNPKMCVSNAIILFYATGWWWSGLEAIGGVVLTASYEARPLGVRQRHADC
jgi:hypothetical protein